MPDVKEVYEMVTQQTPPKPDALERQRKRQMRHALNQKLGAFAVAAAIVGLAVLAVRASGGAGSQQGPTSAGTEPSLTVSVVPKVDYVIDLNTGVMTPLPQAIIRSVAQSGDSELTPWGSRYAASPDGSLLAFVGTGDEGDLQIFIAGVDGAEVRQVTHDPRGATSPAWSPDGTRIAYVGYGGGEGRNLFVLDVTTGQSTQINDETGYLSEGIQFTPDGSSILYTGGTNRQSVLQTVPVDGGKSTVLIGPGDGLAGGGNGSLSPDGSLVTFLSSEIDSPGPGRWVANVDGTNRRHVPGDGLVNPAGTWSPDGSRIVSEDGYGDGIIVVDIATGDATSVAEGIGAIWLDDYTLLVEV